jgi:hypothetical protein
MNYRARVFCLLLSFCASISGAPPTCTDQACIDSNHTFYPEQWQAVGDDVTDDYAALNAAQIACSTSQGQLILSRIYLFNTTIYVQPNCTWIGKGPYFSTGLKPNGSAYLAVYGSHVSGGFAFRNSFRDFLIDASSTAAVNVVDINSSYNISLRDLFLFNVGHVNTNLVGINVANTLSALLENIVEYGPGAVVGSRGVVIGSGAQGITINNPDFENFERNLYITSTAAVDVIGGYNERGMPFNVYIDRVGDGGASIHGGRIAVGNMADGIFVADGTTNVSIFGTQFSLYNSQSNGIAASDTPNKYDNVKIFGVNPKYIHDLMNQFTVY